MDAAYAYAKDIRFPVVIKAAMGGRGPRIVRTEAEFKPAYERASNLQAFGDGRMNPCHIEIQILADTYTRGTARCRGGTRRSSQSPRESESRRRRCARTPTRSPSTPATARWSSVNPDGSGRGSGTTTKHGCRQRGTGRCRGGTIIPSKSPRASSGDCRGRQQDRQARRQRHGGVR